ncbi:hypothetical protein [Crocosphaera sp. Alani8]|uniref:hypothetical protein n=1 Tax=Crocosphaera sp. Alani8 TaxID=3038952 RepID=UPI00313AF530
MSHLKRIQKEIKEVNKIIKKATQGQNQPKLFDDLSHLMRVEYSDRIVVFFDAPHQDKIKMLQAEEDRKAIRVKFITYIGGNSKEELEEIIKEIPAPRHQIRKTKRVPNYPFEMKVSGYSFKQMKLLVNQFTI